MIFSQKDWSQVLEDPIKSQRKSSSWVQILHTLVEKSRYAYHHQQFPNWTQWNSPGRCMTIICHFDELSLTLTWLSHACAHWDVWTGSHQVLAAKLTLFQLGGADYVYHILICHMSQARLSQVKVKLNSSKWQIIVTHLPGEFHWVQLGNCWWW